MYKMTLMHFNIAIKLDFLSISVFQIVRGTMCCAHFFIMVNLYGSFQVALFHSINT